MERGCVPIQPVVLNMLITMNSSGNITANLYSFITVFEAKSAIFQPALRPEVGKPVSSYPGSLETSPQVSGKSQPIFQHLQSQKDCSSVTFPSRSDDIHEAPRFPACLRTHTLCAKIIVAARPRPDTPKQAHSIFLALILRAWHRLEFE